jgi:hypothetical protein
MWNFWKCERNCARSHGTSAAACDNTRSRGGGLEHDVTAAMGTDHFMRDGVVTEANRDHVLLGPFSGLFDRISDFVSLAKTDTNLALLVTSNHKCAETEPTPTLHHLSASIDVNHLFDESTATVF